MILKYLYRNIRFKIIFILLLLFIINFYISYYYKYYLKNIYEYANNDSLILFQNSLKCPSTLYFFSRYRKFNNSYNLKKMKLKNIADFITYYSNSGNFREYLNLLEREKKIRNCPSNIQSNNLIFLVNIKRNIPKNEFKLFKLNKYQKVYPFINASFWFKKNSIYKSYYSMKKLFFNEFDYMPKTYNYPEDIIIIEKKFNNYKFNLNDLWLVKPSSMSCGMGISFFSSLKSISFKEFLITKYINDIHLINGKKYDLRLYVLITGLKPLRIYFYNEGLIRIASEKYFLNISNINDKYIHLTNIYLNKYNKNFIVSNNTNDINANIWNIFMYKKFLKFFGIEWDGIKVKIIDIIIKSIISVYQNLLTEENEVPNINDQSFFDLLGYDIIITEDFIPKLIEINWVPDFKILGNIEKKIKYNLFFDTLNIIGIIPFSKNTGKNLENAQIYKNELDDYINNAFCELKRPRGNYEIIFPKKENIYKYNKYFINNTRENVIFWKKILMND